MNAQDIAASAIEPGDHNYALTDLKAAKRFTNVGFEYEPRVWGAFVGLAWRSFDAR